MTKLIGSAALVPGGDSGTDLTTKGDVHGFSTENTRIPIGSNDTVLTADDGEALGLKWATVSASPTLTRTKVNSTTAQSTSSASLVDLTGFTRTVANVTGKCICSYQTLVESNENYYTAWNFDGSAEPELKAKGGGTFYEPITTMGMTDELSGIVCKMQYRVHDAAGTATAQVDSSNGTAYWMEIS
jgi:hypothetical protein